ncbi:class I SAM-dependent methyltransferase [Candidatus Bipolaricaulota bacterium]|nr:class I SAM-dependent methyltransferase [Candidatus Bipolaricaulota bacterium]
MTKGESYTNAFKSTAYYYSRYRLGYPQEFFHYLRDRFQLDGTGRLLDLGCGTGELAIPLAEYFQEVIGMDPEPEMIAEAEKKAKQNRITNIRWIEGGSYDLEDLQEEIGELTMVTIGTAFHWMDRDAILECLSRMLIPDGVLVEVGSSGKCPTPTEWGKTAKAVIRKWLGEARQAGSSTYEHPKERHEVIFARSPFKRTETYQLEYENSRNIESIIGFYLSTSFCSEFVLGEKKEAFVRDLREALYKINPSGEFKETVLLEATLAWKN